MIFSTMMDTWHSYHKWLYDISIVINIFDTSAIFLTSTQPNVHSLAGFLYMCASIKDIL